MINKEGTKKTPEVIFDDNQGFLSLKGRSVPEDARSFFESLEEAIRSYIDNPRSETRVEIALEYFNTSSSAFILRLFRYLSELNAQSEYKVRVIWFYEEGDDEMREAGMDYKTMLPGLPMETQSVPVFDFRKDEGDIN